MARFVLGVLLLLATAGLVVVRKAERRTRVALLVLSALFLLSSTVRVVDPGTVGIPVVLGRTHAPLTSGIRFVSPLATIEALSIRTQDWTLGTADNADAGSVPVKGSDGASGLVSATLLFRLDPDDASRVFRQLGTDYENMIIRPTMRSCIREAFAKFTIVSAATIHRTDIEADVHGCIESGIGKYGFITEDLQLRDIDVDASVQEAIDRKVQAEQAAHAKRFELDAARTDAEIKRTEAKAVADAEQIIVCGANEVSNVILDDTGKEVETITLEPKEGSACEKNLTPEYLELQRIQALEEFAKNGNSIITDGNLDPVVQLPPVPASG